MKNKSTIQNNHSVSRILIKLNVVIDIFLVFAVVLSISAFAQSCTIKTNGDADCNGRIDLIDYEAWRREFLTLATTKSADFNGDSRVDLIDYESWRRGFLNGPLSPTVTLSPTPTPTGTINPPTGKFYVVGKDIVAPDGNKFVPIGTNLSGIFFWTSPEDTIARAPNAKRWGFNTVRLDGRASEMNTTNYGKLYSWQDMDRLVKAYSDQKIVSILVGIDATGVSPVPVENLLTTYWTEAANRYKNNPYVWFNIVNEPYAWDAPESQMQEWIDFHNRMIQKIRATGSENIILVDAPQNGNDYIGAIPRLGSQIASGKCNVGFSNHPYFAYNSLSVIEDYVSRTQAANLALIWGEFGVPYPPQNFMGNSALSYEMMLNSANNAMAMTRKYGVGILSWHGNIPPNNPQYFYRFTKDGDNFDDINSWTNPTNLTIQGQLQWDYIKQYTPAKFTGSVKNSNCTSAQ